MTNSYCENRRKLDYQDEVLSALRQTIRLARAGRNQTEVMAGLIAETSKLSIKNLDCWERLLRWEVSTELNNAPRIHWKFWSRTTTPHVTWLDLCSGNGFLRENALHELSGPAPNQFFLALAFRRLNDWVPQVKEAACAVLPALAKTTDPDIVADAFCSMVPHCTSWERMEDKGWLVFAEILSVENIRLALMRKITQSSSGPMATILSQIGRTDTLDDVMGEIALNAVQPSVRAKAYRCLLEGRIAWMNGRAWKWTDIRYCKGRSCPIIATRPLKTASSFQETLMSAICDRSPFVRRVAGEMLIRDHARLGANAVKFAELLASDACPSVAERGRFALKMLSE